MAKKPVKKTKKTKKAGKKLKPWALWSLVLLSLSGIAVMIYLTTLHYKEAEGAFCDVNAKLSCSVVNASEYSELMGIPVSILGIGFFTLILGVLLFKGYTRDSLKFIAFISIAFLGPSLYLTALEIFEIGSICLFCELSKVIVLVIVIVALTALRPMKDMKSFVTNGIVVALILAAGTFMVHRVTIETVPEGKYVTFAQNLSDEGWVMYGSETCQFCGRQRAAFGDDAFAYIHEIECDPRNENDQAVLCVAKEVDHTPTWIKEDENGATIIKLGAGMYPLDQLADLTGVELVLDE